MQSIDILRDQHFGAALLLEARQCTMRIIGACMTEPPPSNQAACPIAAPRSHVADERLEHDRPGPLPVAIFVPIVGDPGFGAATGTRQHEQPRVTLDELGERIVVLRRARTDN
jgi:hypothetical protein